jgi:predicted negative regulator of RcsB-dependent stress response
LKRFVFPVALVLFLSAFPATAQQGELDASPTLFTVLAAINAAGYDAEVNSPSNHPLRDEIRNHLAGKNLQSAQALKQFFKDHRQRNETAELSQYISYALVVDGPPDFEYRVRSVEIPPDVVPLDGLSTLLSAFYREANIEDLWQRSQPAFERIIQRYHEPVSQAVLQVNGYLRNETSGFLGRRFQIYIDLLGAPNQVHTRSYGTDYFVVLTPSIDLKTDDIRHAYLHYLIDPLTTKFAQDVLKKRGLSDHALRAPALNESYKEDFLLLTAESLIKAIESRLARKADIVQEALKEGYILSPFFAEELPVFEKQPQSMRLYFPDLIAAVDLKEEEARLAKVEFNDKPRERHARAAATPKKEELTGVQKTLEDAENLYQSRDLEKAKSKFESVLGETSDSPIHARAYYGLARIAVLKNDPDTGEQLFQKALDSSPEPYVRGWVLYYLGRLADVAGDREQAMKYYQETLKVEGASIAARRAADKEIQGISKQK